MQQNVIFILDWPSEEFEYCNRNVARQKSLVQQVSRDPISHDRFMSVFLHFEGRLNRIQSSAILDLSPIIFSVNEELAKLFKEFCERTRPARQVCRPEEKKEYRRIN